MTRDIARETLHYQSLLANIALRRLGLSVLRAFGVTAQRIEDGIERDAVAAEHWADQANMEANCERCRTTPERHEEHQPPGAKAA